MKKQILGQLLVSGFLTLLAACASTPPESKKTEPEVPKVDVSIGEVDKTEELKEVKDAAWDKRETKVEKRTDALTEAVERGNGDEIEKQASLVLAAKPNDFMALNSLAMHHYMNGRLGLAKTLIDQAFQTQKDSATLHNNLGVILLKEGNEPAAIVSFKEALKKENRHPQASANLGLIYARHFSYQKALPYLALGHDKLKFNKNLATAYAASLRGTGNLAKAEGIYKEVIDKEPENSEALLNYAIFVVEYKKAKDEGLRLLGKIKFLETDEARLRLVKQLEDKANELK